MNKRKRSRRITPLSLSYQRYARLVYSELAHKDRNTPARRPHQTASGSDRLHWDGVTVSGKNTFNAKTSGNARERKVMRGVGTTRNDQVYQTRGRKEKDMRTEEKQRGRINYA